MQEAKEVGLAIVWDEQVALFAPNPHPTHFESPTNLFCSQNCNGVLVSQLVRQQHQGRNPGLSLIQQSSKTHHGKENMNLVTHPYVDFIFNLEIF